MAEPLKHNWAAIGVKEVDARQWEKLGVSPDQIRHLKQRETLGYLPDPYNVEDDMNVINQALVQEGYSFHVTIYNMIELLPHLQRAQMRREAGVDANAPNPVWLALFQQAEYRLRARGDSAYFRLRGARGSQDIERLQKVVLIEIVRLKEEADVMLQIQRLLAHARQHLDFLLSERAPTDVSVTKKHLEYVGRVLQKAAEFVIVMEKALFPAAALAKEAVTELVKLKRTVSGKINQGQ